MNPAPQPAAVVAALKETTDRLAELIEGEQDDPSVGIVGWNGLHQLVASNRTLLSTPAAVADAGQLRADVASIIYRELGGQGIEMEKPHRKQEICLDIADEILALLPTALSVAPVDAGQLRERVAKFLEWFAYEVDADGVVSMLPKTDESWKGFQSDADKLLALLPAAPAVAPAAGQHGELVERLRHALEHGRQHTITSGPAILKRWMEVEDSLLTDAITALARQPDGGDGEDKARLDWLQWKALGSSVNATLDELLGRKGWVSIRPAIDEAREREEA